MKKSLLLVAAFSLAVFTVYSQLVAVPKGNAQITDPNSEWPKYTDTIEVKVGRDRDYGTAYVVNLVPKKDMGKYVLPVVIGACEQRGIEEAKFGSDVGRPMTYTLFTTIMEKTGLKVKAVVVSKLEGGVYFADLLVEDGTRQLMFDARPSDAINLAMRVQAPIFVAKKVWDEAKESEE